MTKPNAHQWPYPLLIAHRGGGKLAPENTLAAFEVGYLHGYRMTEFDVKLSRDDVAILLHDDDLKRTGNNPKNARELTAAELENIDVSVGASKFAATLNDPLKGAGNYVPRLLAISEFCLKNNMAVNIEIKPSTGLDTHTAQKVAAEALKLWENAPLAPLFSSFSVEALEALQVAYPDSLRGLLIEEWGADDLAVLKTLKRLDCVSLHVPDKGTTPQRVAMFREAGFAVLVWTVNDVERAKELIDFGANGIITDELAAIKALESGRIG